jgi:hypothetical protein
MNGVRKGSWYDLVAVASTIRTGVEEIRPATVW